MIGTKFYKPIELQEQLDEYSAAAEWCNDNHATIEDKGEYYEVVAIPPPELDEVKEWKIAELKKERDTRELLPVEYNGSSFDFDQKSYERITAAIYALDITGETITWTTADNNSVVVSANDLRSVIANAAARSNALHIHYRELREQVDAAQTAEEVNAITWTD